MGYLFRLLLILLAVWIVVRLWRALRQHSLPHRRETLHDALVQCRHCGTYVPRTEALSHGGYFYCSASHRDVEASGK